MVVRTTTAAPSVETPSSGAPGPCTPAPSTSTAAGSRAAPSAACQASSSRTRVSRAWSGSAVAASASGSGAPVAAARSTTSVRAGSSSNRWARRASVKPSRNSSWVGVGARTASDARQQAAQLVRGDLGAVLVPLLALVAQEVLEGVLPEGLGHELGGLHEVQRLVETAGQRRDPQRLALGVRQRPDVVLRPVGQLVTLRDALKTGGDDDGEGQVGVGRGVDRAVLGAGRGALVRLVPRQPYQGRAVVVPPAHVAGGLQATPQPLVGVDVLVGDRADLPGVAEQAGDEGPAGGRELEVAGGIVEGVVVAFEQGEVGVHARAGRVDERLGH